MTDAPTGPLRIHVRLFAMQRELAGTRSVELELAGPASVADAWTALSARFPALAPAGAFVRYAVNGAYADLGRSLRDGDEVAVIPPVSGGDGSARILELRTAPFPPDLVDELTRRLATPADGAVVTFLGLTRESPGSPAPGQEAEAARHAGRRVERLEYEAFEPLALAVLEAIADEIGDRFGVDRLAIVHRVGEVPLGQASIAVVACAPHRGAAFEAAHFAIEETKARAPIWKAEHFADGHVWVGAPARTGPTEVDG